MIGVVLSAALLLAQATPDAGASANMPAQPAATPAKAPKVNRDGMICHTEEILGSRIPKKVCFTPEQAASREQQDRLNLEHQQSQNGRSY